jgi:hypothetical protein
MGWVRIDDNAPHHRKMLQAGPVACWLWVCGLAHCQRQLSDGFIPIEALPMLGVGNWKKAAGFLVTAGLWHKAEGGYQIHDYLDYNFSAEEANERREAKSTSRADAGRIGGQRSGEARRSKAEAKLKQSASPETKQNEAPSHPIPIPSHPSTTPTASRASSPSLVMGPLQYAKLLEKHAYVGARLRIPNVLHDECRTKLGGENPEARLQAWYGSLDEALERSGEPIPDVFQWLRPKFLEFAQAAVGDAAKAEFLRMVGGANGR